MNIDYSNCFINKTLFIIVTFIVFCCRGEDACSACSHSPPTVLQPGDSGAKCTNAPILDSFTDDDQVDANTCRYYAQCIRRASIVAHLTDNDKSSCLTGLSSMYFLCINSTWMAEWRGDYYPGVDQLYCYESDENSCSKCPDPIQPLQPGNETKCDIGNQTITFSTLANTTNDEGVCMWEVTCPKPYLGVWIKLNDTDSDQCIYANKSFYVNYNCFNGKWTTLACDDETCQLSSYYEFSEIYCVGPKTACSTCFQPPPTVLQSNDSGAKCTNATILDSFTDCDTVDENTCRYYTQCDQDASIVAHLTDKGKSSCVTGLDKMYYMCINSTWMTEVRGNYYPVDQLYCYESDENSCSKCPDPIQPLQPGNETKCDIGNQTITFSTLANTTNDEGVCMRELICSKPYLGVWIKLNDTDSDQCIYANKSFFVTYKCFNGTWTVSTCDGLNCHLLSYHDFDEIYCSELKTATTALTTKGPTKLSTLQSTIHSSTSSTRKISTSRTSPLLQTSTKPITTSLETKTDNKKIISQI